MVRPSDLVILRTSRSADDFWSRMRDEENDVSPNFKALDNSTTPFGRQMRPTFGTSQSPVANVPLKSSRTMERQVLTNEIEACEREVLGNITPNCDPSFLRQLIKENQALKRENATLKKENAWANENLKAAWRLMNGMTGEVKKIIHDKSKD